MYVFRVGYDELLKRLENTVAGKTIALPEVQNFFAEMRRRCESPARLAPVLRFAHRAAHERVLIIGKKVIQPVGTRTWPRSHQVARFSFVGVAPVELAADLHAAVAAWPWDHEAVTIDGKEFSSLEISGGGDEPHVLARVDGSNLEWATSPEALSWIARASESSATLATSDAFRATIAPLIRGRDDDPIAAYYYDHAATWKDALAGPDAKFWAKLSWSSVDSCAGATFVEGDHFVTRHYLRLGSERRGLFRHTRTSRIPQDWLARVPSEASGFTTGLWEATGFFRTVLALYLKLSGDFNMPLTPVEPNVAPLDPVLSHVGPRYLVYRVPGNPGSELLSAFPALGLAADLVVVAELSDAAAFRDALAALLRGLDNSAMAFESRVEGGWTVLSSNLGAIHPSFAINDQVVIFTCHSVLRERATAHWERPADGLVTTDEFKSAFKAVSPDACFLMYFPPGGFARGVYPPLMAAAGRSVNLLRLDRPRSDRTSQPLTQRPGIDGGFFPPADALVTYVRTPTIVSAHDDGAGILFESRAPLLTTPYFWAYVPIIDDLGLYAGAAMLD